MDDLSDASLMLLDPPHPPTDAGWVLAPGLILSLYQESKDFIVRREGAWGHIGPDTPSGYLPD